MKFTKKELKPLDGCRGCAKKCQWNGPVAPKDSAQNKDVKFYPCHSRNRTGRK
ncbi:MAG: hypothetical protein V1867_02135 [Candidatus Falkowbacteria bacterium]